MDVKNFYLLFLTVCLFTVMTTGACKREEAKKAPAAESSQKIARSDEKNVEHPEKQAQSKPGAKEEHPQPAGGDTMEKEPAGEADTVQSTSAEAGEGALPQIEDPLLREAAPVINDKGEDWVAVYEKLVPGFSLAMFEKTSEQTDWKMPEFKPVGDPNLSCDQTIEEYDWSRYLIVSSDGRYGIFTEFGLEPDSWVDLVDIINCAKANLWTMGTCCSYNEAYWFDDRSFFVLETRREHEQAEETFRFLGIRPYIHIIDMDKGVKTVFSGPLVAKDTENVYGEYAKKLLQKRGVY